MSFVTLAQAYEIAGAAEPENFLRRLRDLLLTGEVTVSGYPNAIEPQIERSRLQHVIFSFTPDARRAVLPFELADMRISFAWAGIAYKGAPELLDGLTMVSSIGRTPTALDAFTDVLFPRAHIETHFKRGLEAAFSEAAGRPLSVNEQKRKAVERAIPAEGGVAMLRPLHQKVREAKIIERVKADTGLSVSDKFVRDIFRNVGNGKLS